MCVLCVLCTCECPGCGRGWVRPVWARNSVNSEAPGSKAVPVTSAGCGRRNRTPADRLRLARTPGAPGRDGGECEQRRALVGRLAGACAHAVSAARGPGRCARNGARWNQSWAQGGPDAPGLCFEGTLDPGSRIHGAGNFGTPAGSTVQLYSRCATSSQLATGPRMTSPGVPANARTKTRAM